MYILVSCRYSLPLRLRLRIYSPSGHALRQVLSVVPVGQNLPGGRGYIAVLWPPTDGLGICLGMQAYGPLFIVFAFTFASGAARGRLISVFVYSGTNRQWLH